MRAKAYLLRSGAVDVRQDDEAPNDWLAWMPIDIGVSEDFSFLVRMAEKKMLDRYAIVDGKAAEIQPHCGERTFRIEKQRFNVNGERHECRNRRKK